MPQAIHPIQRKLPSIIKGWNAPKQTFIDAHSKGELHKLVTHFWNFCNLSCPGCFVNKVADPDGIVSGRYKKRYPDEISVMDQIELFKEARDLGAKVVDVVGSGEPTLDPNFNKLLDEAEKLGLYLVIFTHGSTPNVS